MADDPRAGSNIGGCRIEQLIGRGGMGVVYRAEQLNLHRKVAIKLITPELADDELLKERFQQEARLAASLDHPNIVPVHEAGEDDGVLYITMQFIAGTDLRAAIAEAGWLAPERAAWIVAQVAAALDAAHARGLVHRDIKPANVLLMPGDDEHAYLTDFGLTKLAESSGGFTRSGAWVGTVDYVAPEQLDGSPGDARSDVYALGCLCYEALTGHVPYPRETDAARMWAKMQEPLPLVSELVPGVPICFDTVLGRALARDPSMRYHSAGDLGRAALAAAEGRVLEETDHDVATGAAAGAVIQATPDQLRAPQPTQADGIASPPVTDPAVAAPPRDLPPQPAAQLQLPWRRRHRLLVRIAQVMIAALIVGVAAAALIVLRLSDGSADAARAALTDGRKAVNATASSLRQVDRLREIRAAGSQARPRLGRIDDALADARKLDDARLRRTVTATLRGDRTYVAGVADLAEMSDSQLKRWGPAKIAMERGRLQVAKARPGVAGLKLGSQHTLLPASAGMSLAVRQLDDVIPRAAKRLRKWKIRLQKAKVARRAELAALDSYAGAMRGYLQSYDALRKDTQEWSDGVDNTTYDEAYQYLYEGAQKRQAIKDGMSALSAPGAVDGSHSTIVGLLGQSVAAMQRASDGLAENQFSEDGSYFRDTAGWQEFVSTSDSISSQLSSARGSWESGIAGAVKEAKNRPLPERPDV